MKREDLGEYFIQNGELYLALAYIDNPAIELKNVKTGQKELVVIGSSVSREYSKLFKIPVEEDGYNLDKATPVDEIYLENKGEDNETN